jgi:hypothetical protein
MRPLRRRPKQLDELPRLYEAASGGSVVQGDGVDRREGAAPLPAQSGAQRWMITTEQPGGSPSALAAATVSRHEDRAGW